MVSEKYCVEVTEDDGLETVIRLEMPLFDMPHSMFNYKNRDAYRKGIVAAAHERLPEYFAGCTDLGNSPSSGEWNQWQMRDVTSLINVWAVPGREQVGQSMMLSALRMTGYVLREDNALPLLLKRDEEVVESFQKVEEFAGMNSDELMQCVPTVVELRQIAYVLVDFLTGDYASLRSCVKNNVLFLEEGMHGLRYQQFEFNKDVAGTSRRVQLGNPTRERVRKFHSMLDALSEFFSDGLFEEALLRHGCFLSYASFGHTERVRHIQYTVVGEKIDALVDERMRMVEEELRRVSVPDAIQGMFAFQRDEK